MGLFDSLKDKIGKGLSDYVETVGDFIPGIGDSRAADEANQANAKSAAGQMAFQERMSNTAYQRAMADMKKAGLNPMLAMSQGGASTPSGAMSTAQPAAKTKLAEFGMNAATGLSGIAAQKALTANTLQDSVQNRQLSQSQTAKNVADAQKTQLETNIRKKDVPAANLKEDIFKKGTDLIRNVLDNISNSAKQNAKNAPQRQERLIKALGPSNQKPVKQINKGN
ncbi:MAG: DNA pilot protein [Microviridae sp.]|nr:MAG: DNA pilot protein [Microviridae sp.]